MGKKIERNDPCPCGSGKKYKKCCLGKEDNHEYSDITKFADIYKATRKAARFKECIHPDKCNCSEKIIGAHSIQNNKILSKIADNGMLYMPCPKPDLSFTLQNKYGRKEATVFSGFCGYHDKTTFQPIEDKDYIATEEQIFLYVYRAFAIEYHKKQESVRMHQIILSNKPSAVEMPGMTIDGKTGFDMAVADFEEEKKIFDKALMEKRYDVLTSIVWEFNGFSNFAATAGETPMYDFDGKQIQDLLNPSVPARHVYTCVFPENGKTYVIIAWLKEYDGLFLPMKERLESLTEDEKKNYINNTIAITTENVVIKPSAWDAMPETAKQAFTVLFLGMADMLALDGKPYDRFEKPSFDLFSI